MADDAGDTVVVAAASSSTAPAKPRKLRPIKTPKVKTPKAKVKAPESKVKKAQDMSPSLPGSHPTTAVMVKEAIAKLADRTGSSLIAIKKSMAESHQVDVDKLNPFIKRYLKKAVEKGELVQLKGTGATGSFKLPSKKVKAKSKVVAKTESEVKGPSSAPGKKIAVVKAKVRVSLPTVRKVKVDVTAKKPRKLPQAGSPSKVATVPPPRRPMAPPRLSLPKKTPSLKPTPAAKKPRSSLAPKVTRRASKVNVRSAAPGTPDETTMTKAKPPKPKGTSKATNPAASAPSAKSSKNK